jgi:hypothetical protein
MTAVSDPVGDSVPLEVELPEGELGLLPVLPELNPRKTSAALDAERSLALCLTPLPLDETTSLSLLVVDESSTPHLVPALVTRPCPRVGPSPLTSRAVSKSGNPNFLKISP